MIITELNFAAAADRCRPSPGGGHPSTSPSPSPPPSPFTVCRFRRRRRSCPSTHVVFAVSRLRSVHNNLHQWGTGFTRPKSSWRSVSERWVSLPRPPPTRETRLVLAACPTSTFDNGLRALFFPVYFFLNFCTRQVGYPGRDSPITRI